MRKRCGMNCTIPAGVNHGCREHENYCEKYECTQKAETQTPTCAEWISRFRQDVKNRCREMDFTKNIEQLRMMPLKTCQRHPKTMNSDPMKKRSARWIAQFRRKWNVATKFTDMVGIENKNRPITIAVLYMLLSTSILWTSCTGEDVLVENYPFIPNWSWSLSNWKPSPP